MQRRPLAVAACAALVAVCAADAAPDAWLAAVLLALVVLCGAAVAWWLAGRTIGLCVLLMALLAGGLHGWRVSRQQAFSQQIAQERLLEKSVILTGEVRRISYHRDGRWGGLVRLPERRAVWWNGAGDAPKIGQMVTARGSWIEIRAPRNPGEFPLQEWLWRMEVSGQFEALRGTQELHPLGPVRAQAEAFRQWFHQATVIGLDPGKPETTVIRAVVLGEIEDGADVLIHAYRNSGTMHVFSVSGLHVGMVGALVWFAAWLCRVPRRWSAGLVIIVLFGYAWVTGWTPPAVRAAWMASLVVAGFLVRRPADVGNLLGAALLGALLVDGHAIFQPGVQLSYGVVGVLLWAGRPLSQWISQAWEPDPFLPRSLWSRRLEWTVGGWRWLCGATGASAAAWLGSAPLTAWHFRLLTPVAVLASVVIAPLVFLMLALGFVVVAVSPVSPDAAAWLNRGNAQVARMCTGAVTWFARLPGGNIALAPREAKAPYLLIYDLPYGGGATCWVGKDQALLCDCGNDRTFARTVLPSLRSLGAEPERILLTHPDAGHVGGALLGMDTLPLRELWWPVSEARSKVYQEIQQQGAVRKLRGGLFRANQSWQLGDEATLTALAVSNAGDANARADDRVAILRWECKGWRILQVSDAGLATERALLASGIDLRADVLIMGRHATDLSGSEEFLEAVSPRIVVASHAQQPVAARIPASLARWCEHNGAVLFHQGESGAVTIRPGQDALEAEGFVDRKMVRLRRAP